MHHSDTSTDYGRLAVGLGWFSVALGVAELAAPSQMARLIGARDSEETRNTLRLFGARELANGIAILSQPDRSQWLWSRVGGDAIDLAWLGSAMPHADTTVSATEAPRKPLARASAVAAPSSTRLAEIPP